MEIAEFAKLIAAKSTPVTPIPSIFDEIDAFLESGETATVEEEDDIILLTISK